MVFDQDNLAGEWRAQVRRGHRARPRHWFRLGGRRPGGLLVCDWSNEGRHHGCGAGFRLLTRRVGLNSVYAWRSQLFLPPRRIAGIA
jgi:hypothetical protein